MSAPTMVPGYAFRLDPIEGTRVWRSARSEDWDTVLYSPTGREVFQGQRTIDGVTCYVFLCEDREHRAQTKVACGGGANLVGWARA